MLLNVPPAMTCPSGVSTNEKTSPSMLGAKLGSITPVVASKAKIRLRAMLGPSAVCRTWVNEPPAIILLPTWTMA